MSGVTQGPDWWVASDGKWYPPDLRPEVVPLPGQARSQSGSQSSHSVLAESPATSMCTSGHAMQPVDAFCRRCGSERAAPKPILPVTVAATNICTSGHEMPPGEAFCRQCGSERVIQSTAQADGQSVSEAALGNEPSASDIPSQSSLSGSGLPMHSEPDQEGPLKRRKRSRILWASSATIVIVGFVIAAMLLVPSHQQVSADSNSPANTTATTTATTPMSSSTTLPSTTTTTTTTPGSGEALQPSSAPTTNPVVSPPPPAPPVPVTTTTAAGTVEIPYVIGSDVQSAESAITSAGLSVGSVSNYTNPGSSPPRPNSIIDGEDPLGVLVAPGTAINLEVCPATS